MYNNKESDFFIKGKYLDSNNYEISFTNWQSGQPSVTYQGSPQDCVMLWTDNEWNDAYCDNLNPFVCSKQKTAQIVVTGDTFKDVNGYYNEYGYFNGKQAYKKIKEKL